MKSLHQYLSLHAHATPNSLALEDDKVAYTYAEQDQKVTKAAAVRSTAN